MSRVRTTTWSASPVAINDAGIDLAEDYGLSIYDTVIAAAAISAECDILFSEDLQDGLLISGQLRVVNAFSRKRR